MLPLSCVLVVIKLVCIECVWGDVCIMLSNLVVSLGK
jgi:hypothetical protein